MTRRLLPYGAEAVLLECDDLAEALALRAVVKEQIDKVVEVVPGARTLLLRLRAPLTDRDRRRLLSLPEPVLQPVDQEPITITVDYSGDDLAEVSRLTGLSETQVIEAHTGQQWTVAFCGFAPGFGYLSGEDDRLRVPRRASPRAKVPAGAVGLADVFSGIYPREGPGGWQLIGRTDARLWDLDRDEPALLRPGVRVQFEAA